MSFDFRYTCPIIDKEIEKARASIQQAFEELLEKACPLMSMSDIRGIASDAADDLYMDIGSCFETVRSTNEDMRSAAEDQIDDLMSQIMQLNDTIDSLSTGDNCG